MLQRQQFDQETLDFITRQRAYHRHEADVGADDYLPEQDRRNREHVLGPNCRVQEDDDVLLNGEIIRVIGAARQEGWFYGLQLNPFSGVADVPYDGQYVTDRAPADSNDEPLPIRIDPPETPAEDANEEPAAEPEVNP